jgi:predicted permease
MLDSNQPDWKRIVRNRLASLQLEGSTEASLIEEMSQHLEDRYRELRSGGATEEEALRDASAELEDLSPLKTNSAKTRQLPKHEPASVGDPKRASFFGDLGRDLRYAGRSMRKAPGFVVFVVLVLGLGIGANTTVFTVINTLVLNPLPVPDSGKLAGVHAAKASARSKSAAPLPLTFADLKDIQAKNDTFQTLAGYSSPRGVTLQTGAGSQNLFSELVTANYFEALGLRPARGRFFLPEEDGVPGAHPVVVMNYGTWQSHFGGKADVVGQTMRINHLEFTVIGIAPPHFIGVSAVFGPDLWMPVAMAEQLFPTEMRNVFSDRGKGYFLGVGQLRSGIEQAQAMSNVQGIGANLAREYPATNEDRTFAVRPVREILFSNASATAATVLFASAGLLAVVGIVLLIACSNVANLLLARAAARKQEVAVRLALGASRRRLVRQFLTESVALGLLSGLTGLFLAYAGLRLLFGVLPSSSNFITPKFDPTVFSYALAVSLITGFVFGIVPALQASHVGVAEALKEEVRTMGRSRSKVSLANALLIGQVALSFLLLVMAGLFLRSIGKAYQMDPGFQTGHLAVFMTNPGQAGYGKPQTKAFYRDVRERVEALPRIASAAWASNLPLWANLTSGLQVEGRQAKNQADRIAVIVNTVTPEYFGTAGVTVKNGRAFRDSDRDDSLPVAMVNEKLAQQYWPGQSALGKRIQVPGETQFRQVVGVARNANYTNWAEPPQACVYIPFEQNYLDGMVLYVKSQGDPKAIVSAVEKQIRTVGPAIHISTQTGPEVVTNGLFFQRVGVALLTVFGVLALLLASIGLYGILAYAVSQRRREIGLRLALGAAQPDVVGMILKQGLRLVATGILIGLGAALAAGMALRGLLYGVNPGDPLSVGGAAAVLLIVALLACYLPARWASRVDPLMALRES